MINDFNLTPKKLRAIRAKFNKTIGSRPFTYIKGSDTMEYKIKLSFGGIDENSPKVVLYHNVKCVIELTKCEIHFIRYYKSDLKMSINKSSATRYKNSVIKNISWDVRENCVSQLKLFGIKNLHPKLSFKFPLSAP